jgi:hypothetical protein
VRKFLGVESERLLKYHNINLVGFETAVDLLIFDWRSLPESNSEGNGKRAQCALPANSLFPVKVIEKETLIDPQLSFTESPTDISVQRVGDSGDGDIVASAGEEVELECVVSGGNPPASIKWFTADNEIESGHTQENRRSAPEARTWVSVSRLTLPVNKEDNGAKVRCVATHPTLQQPLTTVAGLTIHCKYLTL